MPYEQRRPEGRAVDEAALGLFSRVARWTGKGAAFRVNRILGASPGPGMKVLDIGTGPGVIPLHLQRFYPDAHFIGMDISLDMLERAKENRIRRQASLKLLAGDGEILPLGDNTLHVITSFFALHHMDEPERLLKEVDRVLTSDGDLLIIDFRRDMSGPLFHVLDASWQFAFFLSAGRYGFRDSVRSAWQPDEIKSILARNNLFRFQVHANAVELWSTRSK